MLKYLAVGLIAALLLDATVIRMFLVPAIMKLLGDDCWWAPQWMKRIQERLGLGETELPDERKRPAMRDLDEDAALVGAGAPVRPRPQLDPTHPAVDPPRARPARVPQRPPRSAPPTEPPTTRIPKQRRGEPAPRAREDREIESWLGALKDGQPGGPPPRQRPPVPRQQPVDAPTTAIRAQPPQGTPPQGRGDPDATEKLDTRNTENKEKEVRRRGAVSALDLLRREGRL
jgi:RND superfamily putative drug exporter